MKRILLVHGTRWYYCFFEFVSCMSATAAAAPTVSDCATSSSRIRQNRKLLLTWTLIEIWLGKILFSYFVVFTTWAYTSPRLSVEGSLLQQAINSSLGSASTLRTVSWPLRITECYTSSLQYPPRRPNKQNDEKRKKKEIEDIGRMSGTGPKP